MRAVQVTRWGGPDVFTLVDAPEPVIDGDHIAVAVSAASVNPIDWWTATGAFRERLPELSLPYLPGWAFVGTVIDGGRRFAAGQRVAGVVPWFGTRRGSWAERVAVDESWLSPVPEALSTEAAAGLALSALAAAQLLDRVVLQKGENVLVTGASGAVGGVLSALAIEAGAHVIAQASWDDEQHVRDLGVAQVLERGEPLPRGFDVVLEAVPVGTAVIDSIRDGGRLGRVTGPGAPAPERGISVTSVVAQPRGDQLGRILELAAAGRVPSRVAASFPSDEVCAAVQAAMASGLRGKVILRF